MRILFRDQRKQQKGKQIDKWNANQSAHSKQQSSDMKGARPMALQTGPSFIYLCGVTCKQGRINTKRTREALKHPHSQVFCLGLIVITSELELGVYHKLLCNP